jgi:hypothetical protein
LPLLTQLQSTFLPYTKCTKKSLVFKLLFDVSWLIVGRHFLALYRMVFLHPNFWIIFECAKAFSVLHNRSCIALRVVRIFCGFATDYCTIHTILGRPAGWNGFCLLFREE